jgi:hypothetical protein
MLPLAEGKEGDIIRLKIPYQDVVSMRIIGIRMYYPGGVNYDRVMKALVS